MLNIKEDTAKFLDSLTAKIDEIETAIKKIKDYNSETEVEKEKINEIILKFSSFIEENNGKFENLKTEIFNECDLFSKKMITITSEIEKKISTLKTEILGAVDNVVIAKMSDFRNNYIISLEKRIFSLESFFNNFINAVNTLKTAK